MCQPSNTEEQLSNLNDLDKLEIQKLLTDKSREDSCMNPAEAVLYTWFTSGGIREQTKEALDDILSYWNPYYLVEREDQKPCCFKTYVGQCIKLMDTAIVEIKNKK